MVVVVVVTVDSLVFWIVVVIILASAPEDEPVIFSPLTNVPVTVPNVNVGAVASELEPD